MTKDIGYQQQLLFYYIILYYFSTYSFIETHRLAEQYCVLLSNNLIPETGLKRIKRGVEL